MRSLKMYEPIIGKEAVQRIRKKAEPLNGIEVLHMNSTMHGGGVAEILNSVVLLLNDLGIKTHWRVLKAKTDFFYVTKKIHNALQGQAGALTEDEIRVYENTAQTNAAFTSFDYDVVIIHDPQPLLMGTICKKDGQPWIWRCHVDLSQPNKDVWEYLKPHVERYDRVVVSKEEYKQELSVPQRIIHPAIDPLSDKNRNMRPHEINQWLERFGIDPDRPIITQVSRFDKWKDPVGVIKTYRIVKQRADCQLVLLGSAASDDPEGQVWYEAVLREARGDPDIKVINFESDLLVNALQRASDVVLQKSLREGFALTVSEALWKETPVVASDVGGIGLQDLEGVDGHLVSNIQEAADAVVDLLDNPEKARRMGLAGKEIVREQFLTTRLLEDWLDLLAEIIPSLEHSERRTTI